MQPLDPIRADEAGRLAQEAELLRYEVRHLRARLAAAEADAVPPKNAKKKQPDAGTAQRDRQAYDDLVWLLGRLDSSPAGPVLRRMSGFGTLRDRYLGGGPE